MLGEFAKYAFCGLKRKRRDFERSVLKYVSIKIPALTHSGRKSRVCVNQPDRLTPPLACFAFSLLVFRAFHPALNQKLVVASPSLYSPERMRRRRLVLSEFAKYAFFLVRPKKSGWRKCARQARPLHQALFRLPAFLPSSTRQCPRKGQTTDTVRPHQAE